MLAEIEGRHVKITGRIEFPNVEEPPNEGDRSPNHISKPAQQGFGPEKLKHF
jgi:hypothetical protein